MATVPNSRPPSQLLYQAISTQNPANERGYVSNRLE
jgi:hypothetical protein